MAGLELRDEITGRRRRGSGEREEQQAFRSEPLRQRTRRHTGFGGNLGQRELTRCEPHWEAAIANAGGGGGGGGDSGGITTYVFSRTLEKVGHGAHLVRDHAGEFVRQLKDKPGKGICVMGGGELAQSLLAAGVIDEVGMNVHPILLGSGVPLFRDAGRRIALELIESRVIDGGCVLSTYRVTIGNQQTGKREAGSEKAE
jgi:RibD C-terminal domain